ncbi:hypothetical protein CKO50_09695 [Pseudoalteromonas sp. HM-SA03]|uniref:hypothetical protein n=1 Tax=Pseudoalteromonas sp. HM-SA03 TaxID=2029678 RepID=UPI000BADFECC|nr:hypothetical protein [Pseudoalteromonas sp. HM-SA03]PAY01594.1 hypothetical protein CKO50_09695 [Pseudoalteromonas sp. HM-SA03]
MDMRIHPSYVTPPIKTTVPKSKDSTQAEAHQENVQLKSDTEEQQDVPIMLSKELDKEAAEYKEDNAVFKKGYEDLEKAMDLIQAQIQTLQARINKLMQDRGQRFMKINHQQDTAPDEEKTIVEHVGSKKYRDNTTIDEVKELEKQLSEFKGQEAEMRIKMLKMILAERERLEELKRKGKL